MSKEELLKPRYLVIADYPNYTGGLYTHKKGDIIVFDTDNEVTLWKKPGSDGTLCDHEHFESYPEIFHSLPWWKDRKSEDMPEFVTDGKCVVSASWHEDIATIDGTEWLISNDIMRLFQPATKEEYDQYDKQ